MRVTISATWLRQPWAMPVWDMAYDFIVRAGSADVKAKQQLDGIKLAAQAGNVQAAAVQRNFDAVAKLILKGLPKPSEFVRSRQRQSPLLPGTQRGKTQAQTALAATVKKQQAQLQKQKALLAAQKRESIVRAQKGRLMSQAQAAVARVEDQLAAVETVLQQRDLADEMRTKLEAQAAEYEAEIERLQAPVAVRESETTSEPMAAEQVEAEQDDSAQAYPSGAPGDVEFADAGT